MKSKLLAAAALAGSLALLPTEVVASKGVAPSVRAQAQAPAVLRDWKSDFMKSYKIGDRKGMARIARDHDGEVAAWILELAARVTTSPTDEDEKLYTAVGRAWSEAFNTAFADNVREFFADLDAEERAARIEVLEGYREVTTRYFKLRADAAGAARDAKLQEMGEEFDAIATQFYEIGDMYYASRAWVFAGDAFSPRAVREEAASAKRELEFLSQALDACRIFDIGDPTHTDTKSRVRTLEIAVERGAGEGADAAEAAPTALPFTFGPASTGRARAEVFDDMKKRARLTYGWDEAHPTWPSMWLGEIGSATQLPGMSGGPRVERIDDRAITVTGVDGSVSRVDLSTEPQLVETTVDGADGPRGYGFFVQVGLQTDEYLGFAANLEPTASGLTVYLKPAGAVGVEVAGEELFVSDDNFDGAFGGAVVERTGQGLPSGVTMPVFDGVFGKRDKTARPFSRLIQLGKAWHSLEVADGGAGFTVAPATALETGTVKLSFGGPDLEWLVVRGEGALADVYLALDGKKAELPVGTYRVFAGVVREKEAKALMLAGDAEPFVVTAGGTTELELGEPFRFDFSASLVADGVKVRGSNVRIVGAGGEHYYRWWGCVPKPTIHLRAPGGSWKEAGTMGRIEDIDALSARGSEGWNDAWWPLDTTVPNEVGDEYEVRLVEKKNPLFGTIDSAQE